jgi:putative transcriptional regulator
MARDLVKAGAMDEVTMRKTDALCLPRKRPFTAGQIRRIRTNNHVSQAVFAAFMGTGKTTVQQWEQGVEQTGFGGILQMKSIIEK